MEFGNNEDPILKLNDNYECCLALSRLETEKDKSAPQKSISDHMISNRQLHESETILPPPCDRTTLAGVNQRRSTDCIRNSNSCMVTHPAQSSGR